MRKLKAISLYVAGQKPTIEQLEGKWKVSMWGWWSFMRLDRKVIKGTRGYNRLLGIKWGGFTVSQDVLGLVLTYDEDIIMDHLKVSPDNDNVMVGKFHVNGKFRQFFTLTKV